MTERTSLTSQDLASLERSFITLEVARRAGLFRVDSAEGAALVGRNGGGDYAGVVFPYIWPGEVEPREFRLRRDRPELERKGDGALKPKDKYLAPPGRGNLAYIPPGTPPEHLSDTSIQVACTEGEKKALALQRYFVERGERALVVAFSGAWNWRGTVGKSNDETGQRCDVKGPIPDLDRITWEGRTVFVIYDTNVRTNDSVAAARRELAKELKSRGAVVKLVDLPQIDGVNGVDDLLFLKGPEFVSSLFAEADGRPEAGERSGRGSQATALVNLAGDAEFFHAPDGKTFATVSVNSHRETMPLRSGAFKDWLSHRFYLSESTAPPSASLQDALNTLSGKARYDGAEVETYTRVAAHGGSIYLDLCDPRWRAVEVTADGWGVVQDVPVKFRRARGMLALPEPARGGSIGELRRFLNVGSEDDWVLLLSWLVAALRPCGPYPVLALHGEQGSAKSTTARMLRSLVDPSSAPLRGEPRDGRDLVIAASNSWCVSFDNLSKMPVWLSDGLCRLSTGGGFTTRQLYTDDEEVLFDAQRPVLLNGIEELATRADLLDRAIILYLPTIPEVRRRNEAVFLPEFYEARPRILGALLDAVSAAVRDEAGVRLDRLPRMADFAVWASAAESALGLGPGAFMEAYDRNRSAANDLALEASLVAGEILKLMAGRDEWTSTYTDLLKNLERTFGDSPKRPEGWPKSARALAGELTRIAVNLRKAGVDVRPGGRQGGSGRKMVTLARLEEPCERRSQHSQRSQEGENAGENRERGCERGDEADARRSQQHSQDNPSNGGVCEDCERCECEIHASSDEDAAFDEVEGFFTEKAREEAERRVWADD